jgi:hypothetical protein
MRPRPVRNLADGSRRLARRGGDFLEGQGEHLAQDEHRSLRRRQRLEHRQR